MALEQDILLAVSVKTDSILKLHNVDKQFKDFECDLKGFKYVFTISLKKHTDKNKIHKKYKLVFYFRPGIIRRSITNSLKTFSLFLVNHRNIDNIS